MMKMRVETRGKAPSSRRTPAALVVSLARRGYNRRRNRPLRRGERWWPLVPVPRRSGSVRGRRAFICTLRRGQASPMCWRQMLVASCISATTMRARWWTPRADVTASRDAPRRRRVARGLPVVGSHLTRPPRRRDGHPILCCNFWSTEELPGRDAPSRRSRPTTDNTACVERVTPMSMDRRTLGWCPSRPRGRDGSGAMDASPPFRNWTRER